MKLFHKVIQIVRKKNMVQFLKFGIVGLSNTLVSLAVYYVFLWINPGLYMIGNAIGWVVSVANAYYWNNRYVFADDEKGLVRTLRKVAKTYLSYGATFLLTTMLLYVEVDVLQWSSAICPFLNLIISIPMNFLLNKFWAFH